MRSPNADASSSHEVTPSPTTGATWAPVYGWALTYRAAHRDSPFSGEAPTVSKEHAVDVQVQVDERHL